jgi:molecular chaperone HscA
MLFDITEPKEKEIAIGIDLGTTNSLVAISQNGEVTFFKEDGNSSNLIPSVIAVHNKNIIVGKKSLEANHNIRSIKRLMGKSYLEAVEISKHLPYGIIDFSGIPKIKLGTKQFTAIELSAFILSHLKKTAESKIGSLIKKAVITVPAYFDEQARKATIDAAKLAELDVLRIISEPTSAALAYGLDKKVEGTYVVYDFGGGTFDVSILKMKDGVFQVIATGGDSLLGGDDIDIIIKNALNIGVNEAKIIKEKKLAKDKNLQKLVLPIINKTISILRNVMVDSGVEKNSIKGVILVGGSSRIPLISNLIENEVGLKVFNDLNPDEIVAIGAAITAENLIEGSDNLLLDVIPLSLGLEIMGGMVEVIVPRNTVIPIIKTQNFTTYADGQTGMVFHIVQGEREMAHKCRSLAKFELKGIPPMKAGLPKIEVNFSIDADGILKVFAKELISGVDQEIIVKPSFGLTDEHIEKMLIESMENAKEDIQERLLAESKFEALSLIDRLNDAMKENRDLLEANEEELFKKQMQVIQKAIDAKNRDLIDLSHQKLNSLTANFAGKIASKGLEKTIKGKKIDSI